MKTSRSLRIILAVVFFMMTMVCLAWSAEKAPTAGAAKKPGQVEPQKGLSLKPDLTCEIFASWNKDGTGNHIPNHEWVRGTFYIQIIIKNIGKARAEDFRVRFGHRQESTPPPQGTGCPCAEYSLSLDPGQSHKQDPIYYSSANWGVDSWVKVFVEVDHLKKVDESNENNNLAYFWVKVLKY